VALVLIRLKLALMRHSFTGMRVLGLSLAALGAIMTWYFALFTPGPQIRSDLFTLVFVVWAAGWALGPTVASGAGMLRSQYFALLPMDRRRTGALLLVTAFVDLGPVLTLVASAALVWHGGTLSTGAALVAVPAALLLWVSLISLSQLVFRALGAAMHSRLGVEIASVQWGLILALLLFGWISVQPALSATLELRDNGLGAGVTGTVLAVLPTSWPVHAVDAAGSGAWGAALGWLAVSALATAALAAVTAVLLAPRVTARGMRRDRRPLGAPSLSRRTRSPLPDTPLGAVVGKELRQWWRDPWRGLEVRAALWAGLFIGLMAWSSGAFAFFAPFSGVICAFIMVLATANMYGHDGTALWQAVVGQGVRTVPADVRGRQIAIMLLSAPGALALSVLFIVFTGEHWTWPYVLTGLAVVFGVGSGLSLLFSVVALSPGVDPQLRVDANDSGDNQVQVWLSLAALPVLSAPAVLAAVFLGLAGTPWAALPVGVLNGVLAAWGLGRIAHRRLADRLPETFTRIRYGREVALQALPRRGSWMDRLERAAISGNQETKPTGS
jgi:ABC-2 type transport system permease protein